MLSGLTNFTHKLPFLIDPQSATLSLADADINAVAGLVKLYFRELPEPLFTNALYPKFVSGIRKCIFRTLLIFVVLYQFIAYMIIKSRTLSKILSRIEQNRSCLLLSLNEEYEALAWTCYLISLLKLPYGYHPLDLHLFVRRLFR